MELRDLMQVGGALATIVASLAVSKHQVGKHEAQIEAHAEWLATLETSTQLLKQKQDSHTEQIDRLMNDLQKAVDRLQQIAVDLIGLSPRKH